MFRVVLFFLLISSPLLAHNENRDSLLLEITDEKGWWNVLHYNLHVEIFPETKSIIGNNTIQIQPRTAGHKTLQIDLQEPLKIDSVIFRSKRIDFSRIATVSYHIELPEIVANLEETLSLQIFYSGQPIVAKNAPWDGGIVWTKNAAGNDFIASACQGIGASTWWPCKDHWSDEPDLGMEITIVTPPKLMGVSNGQLIVDQTTSDHRITKWEVKNPINSYGVNFNVANYVTWDSIYKGEKGDLKMSFYALQSDEKKARAQFNDAYRTLEAFEHWFGPYPFYKDGYKLVQVPYLGMEHQSSVTYGNGFQNGYLGQDLSGTGWGLKWDFIIIHESGHEWFGNNITGANKADMWIHEGFTTYSEGIFTEYFYGKEAGEAYIRGLRKNILNLQPIHSGTLKAGSYDMYPKGANVLQTLRQWVNSDEKWHAFLRDVNQEFYHKNVSTEQFIHYIESYFNLDLKTFFEQYLYTTMIPELVVKEKRKHICYKWENVVENFHLPLQVTISGEYKIIVPSSKKQKIKGTSLRVHPNYYILQKTE